MISLLHRPLLQPQPTEQLTTFLIAVRVKGSGTVALKVETLTQILTTGEEALETITVDDQIVIDNDRIIVTKNVPPPPVVLLLAAPVNSPIKTKLKSVPIQKNDLTENVTTAKRKAI